MTRGEGWRCIGAEGSMREQLTQMGSVCWAQREGQRDRVAQVESGS